MLDQQFLGLLFLRPVIDVIYFQTVEIVCVFLHSNGIGLTIRTVRTRLVL